MGGNLVTQTIHSSVPRKHPQLLPRLSPYQLVAFGSNVNGLPSYSHYPQDLLRLLLCLSLRILSSFNKKAVYE